MSRRMVALNVDGEHAVAYLLGSKVVVAGGDFLFAKEGSAREFAALTDVKRSDLRSAGFREVKP